VLSRIGWIQQNRPQYRFYGRWLVEALGDTNKTETLTMSVLSRFCCLHESESWKSRFYCVLFLSANQKPGNLGFVIRALRLHVLHSESIKHKKNSKSQNLNMPYKIMDPSTTGPQSQRAPCAGLYQGGWSISPGSEVGENQENRRFSWLLGQRRPGIPRGRRRRRGC
jgi:hypothetical protein